MLLTLNDLILNYWQIKRRFEKEIVIYIFRLVIYIWCYKKRKKNLFHKKEKIWFRENWIRIFADFQVSSSVIFAGYKMREMLLDFVYGICFPLASSILLKCSKLYTCTWQIFKFLGSSKKKYCRKLFFPCSFYYIEVITIL